MVIDNRPLTLKPDNDLVFSISCLLRRRSVMNAAEMARYFSIDVRTIREGLFQLAQTGQIEILRPVGCLTDSANNSSDFNEDYEYFRWKQESDRMYLWQTTLRRRPMLPLHRLFDLNRSIA
ncbi:MAG TPA: hypothetical protein DCZ95_04135 [Verrucomicrobia bacterium]|nr:MAG: hypothetical protein A2X46_15280 [Lentisphaerae bacterium GWF2_57_35]HBA83264.1 hypothetical protein [Verrucomicrobiota bacterium]